MTFLLKSLPLNIFGSIMTWAQNWELGMLLCAVNFLDTVKVFLNKPKELYIYIYVCVL